MASLVHSDCSHLAPGAIVKLGERIGSTKIAETAMANKRLSAKVLAGVLSTHSIFPNGGANPQAAAAARAWLSAPDRFERICGLVIYGSIVRSSVDAKSYRRMAQMFGADDLAIACRIHEANGTSMDNAIDEERLSELVEHAGRNTVLCWFQGIPQDIADELLISSVAARVSGPVRGGRADIALSTRIVCAVAAEFAKLERV